MHRSRHATPPPVHRRTRPQALVGLALAAALTATAGLAVPAAAATTDLLLDFQCAGNPLPDGWTEVAPGTGYTEARGFGLSPTLASSACRNRGELSREDRDFVLATTSTRFLVDLPDGVYSLALHSGDGIASSNTGMVANGVTLDAASPGSGNVTMRVLDGVPVTDGRLEVRFTGSSIRVNALEVYEAVPAPSGLTATAHVTPDPTVDLSWTAAEGGEGHRVQRSVGGGPAERVADLPAGATSWTDTAVGLAHDYTYTVTAVGASGRESVPTEPVEVTTVDTSVAPPSAPAGVAVDTSDGVTLAWEPDAAAVVHEIYRGRLGGPAELLATTADAGWTDGTAEPTRGYSYQVAAVGLGGRSERSAPVDVPARVELARQAERIGRNPVAASSPDGVYVGWAMLGDDPDDVAFHVYRDGERLTDEPLTGSTNLVDPDGDATSTYRVSTVVDGTERWATGELGVWDGQTLDIPLDRPADGTTKDGQPYTYSANDASVADLDGDGAYEYVVKWYPSNAKDNSLSGYTGSTYLDAYELDGTRLWRIDLGVNIRSGAHYTQFQVFDYDGDGRAETIVRTADGTVDGTGEVIGDADADFRNSSGYVLSGPEYLTVFDGVTGAAVDTVDYVPARGSVGAWGDSYGNRVDRFLAGTAYLDGQTPSAIFSRGYYTRSVVAAFDFDGEHLTRRWVFDSDEAGSEHAGQGNHSLSVADVDGDQRDEVVFGSMTLDDDGTVLHNTRLGHGDAQHVSDFDPSRPGLEVFSVHEEMGASGNRGATFRDAGSGEVLWSIPATSDTGRGAMGDIDPRHPGAEGWANPTERRVVAADGEVLSTTIPAANFLTWWDGDLLREIGDHDFDRPADVGVPTVAKWDWEEGRSVELYRAEGTSTSNSTKGNVALQADLFGDWREEIVARTQDSSALRISTTVIPTEHRLRSLMSDSQYRLAVAWQNTGYNQPPHPSYFLGDGMTTPDAPRPAYTTDAVAGNVVWSEDATYREGDVVEHDGALYSALWHTAGETPGTTSWGAWAETGPAADPAPACDAAWWTPSAVFTAGDRAVADGTVWEARWWTRNQQPGASPWGPWQEVGSC
ncbi:hypothetical protein [Isoptericola dokdonensis]|uniref:rhamnogalacturonan lyase family protein n=1 Tax=Isoptericola dokdonensis TaxID=372663 RepID=UPI00082AFB41